MIQIVYDIDNVDDLTFDVDLNDDQRQEMITFVRTAMVEKIERLRQQDPEGLYRLVDNNDEIGIEDTYFGTIDDGEDSWKMCIGLWLNSPNDPEDRPDCVERFKRLITS